MKTWTALLSRLSRPKRLLPLLVVALAAVAALASGSVVQTASAAGCTFPATSTPFQPWLDFSSYFLAPGGNFESGLTGYATSGGAGLVPGSESYDVGGPGQYSLGLPTSASSVTTPTFCVSLISPTIRLFVKNNRPATNDGRLAIYLNYTQLNGRQQQIKVAALTSRSTSWTLSPVVAFVQYLLAPELLDGYANVSFTLKPSDNDGSWQVDDLYVDPFHSR